MLRALLRLLGSGELPPEGREIVGTEGQRLMIESVKGSITFRNYRAPGRYSWRRRQYFLGSLAITPLRLVAYRYSTCLINVPFSDPKMASLEITVEKIDTICFRFDAAAFDDKCSGEVVARLLTERAKDIAALVESLAKAQRRD